MSREAVNQIIDRAVADEAYFQLLREDPEQAIAGFELDPAEISAFKAGAYNVVVRATRKDREAQAALDASRAARATAAAAPAPVPSLIGSPQPPPPKTPAAGLVGFLIGVIIIGGGIGSFRYFEKQWPWQALGFGRAAAPASIPAPSLGARPKPSAAPARTAAPSGAPATVSRPSASASGQARLRPTPEPSTARSAAPSSNQQQLAVEKAYYQAVGTRLQTVVKTFAATLRDVRSGADATNDVRDLTSAVNDLSNHMGDAPPPDQLKQQHLALTQAVPLMQANLDLLRDAVSKKNGIQAILIAGEIESLLNQVSDEVAFAQAPHPEIYQPIDSSQPLSHILNFDVLGQNVTARNNAPASVVVRIGLQSANPSPDEVSDTLRHGVVAARQSFPQAGQVRIVAFKEANGAVGSQVGTADWYCSPDAHPPDAGSSGAWQDSCGKIYVAVAGAPGGNGVTAVPY